MKKQLLLFTILFTSLTGWAQCNFSGITFRKTQQVSNTMYFETNMGINECWGYDFMVYDYQLGTEDTLMNMGGWTGVSFGKGKYQMRLKVFNECLECDTTFTIDIDITIFNTLGYSQKIHDKMCNEYTFEMEDRNDTCYEYYYTIYKSDTWINSLTDEEWETVSDSAIYFNYDFSWETIDYNSDKSERVLKYNFKDSGRYFVLPTLFNKCTAIDTWAFKKLNVCNSPKTVSVKKIVPPIESITVVGYYNLMGQRVDYMEPNKIYVVLYSDGRRLKVMRRQ